VVANLASSVSSRTWFDVFAVRRRIDAGGVTAPSAYLPVSRSGPGVNPRGTLIGRRLRHPAKAGAAGAAGPLSYLEPSLSEWGPISAEGSHPCRWVPSSGCLRRVLANVLAVFALCSHRRPGACPWARLEQRLALLWQIYSSRFASVICLLQYGHR
jgi:hypothetical protein